MAGKFLTIWADRLQITILNRIGFWSDGLHYFHAEESHVSLMAGKGVRAKKLIMVVSRGHYFESVKDYPVGNKVDLKAVLKNEPWRYPFEGLLFQQIERRSEQVHRVTSWVIKQSVVDNFSSAPLWIIPETACFKSCLDGKSIGFSRLGETVFVADTPDGMVSSLGREDLFTRRVGGFSSENTHTKRSLSESVVTILKAPAAADQILIGTLRVLKTPTVFFAGFRKKVFSVYQCKIAAQFSVVAGVLYLAASSSFLLAAGTWFDYSLSQKLASAENALATRQTIKSYQVRLEGLRHVIEANPPLWVLWDVFIDLKSAGVLFRASNSAEGAVTLYMTATKATDVLALLKSDARVQSAEFTLPVRKNLDAEDFAIRILLKDVTVIPQSEVADRGVLPNSDNVSFEMKSGKILSRAAR